MLWGLLLLSFPLNAGNISFVSSSEQKTKTKKTENNLNNWMCDTWRKMDWLDEVDRLDDIESSPVSYNICLVNAMQQCASCLRAQKGDTKAARHTHAHMCMRFDHQLAMRKTRYSPFNRFYGKYFAISLLQNGDDRLFVLLHRNDAHSLKMLLKWWQRSQLTLGELLITCSIFLHLVTIGTICWRYYDVICKMIFKLQHHIENVPKHSFPGPFVHVAHADFLTFFFFSVNVGKKEGSPKLWFSIVVLHKKTEKNRLSIPNVSLSLHKKCLFHKIYLLNSQTKAPKWQTKRARDDVFWNVFLQWLNIWSNWLWISLFWTNEGNDGYSNNKRSDWMTKKDIFLFLSILMLTTFIFISSYKWIVF